LRGHYKVITSSQLGHYLGFRDQYSLAHPKAKLDNAPNKQAPFGTGNQRNPLKYQVPGGKK